VSTSEGLSMTLNYNHLYYFHVAAQEGSVGAAAGKLGVTQPTVSEQLRALERALGTTLFERHPTGLKLSEAGRIAYEHTSVMFGIGDRLVRDLDPTPEPTRRWLRVGVSGAVARVTSGKFLLPLLGLDATPSIKLIECNELMRSLKAGMIDLVLCENTPPESEREGLVVRLVEPLELVAIGGPGCKPQPDWRDISLVQYSAGTRLRWSIDAYLAKHRLTPRIAAEADDAMFLVEIAAAGRHVAIVPTTVAKDAISAGRVTVVATLPSAEHAGIHAIYRNSDAQELARQAVDLLVRRP
jgi:LysR family transcriptional activator of nhaA